MFEALRRLSARVQELRRDVDRMRNLVRLGRVAEVDSSAGTVVVEFPEVTAEGGSPHRSMSLPWLQRSTEHRPPAVGDHALVVDPSLGRGAALVVAGWPSLDQPPVDGGGDVDVIHRQRGGSAGDVYDGADRTIVAGDLLVDADAIAMDAPDIELGVNPTDYAALASRVDQLWLTLHTMFVGWVPAPMDGGAALKAQFTASFPSPPQSVAAQQVKVK